MSYLSIDSLEKTYPDGTRAVKGIDLTVDEGEFIVLLGPSGCGKTTTLRMVAGLEIPTAGRIALAGKDVTTLRPAQRDVGFVFQFYALYPHLSVRENVLFPLKATGMAKAEREQALENVVDRLGIGALLDRYPSQLSGGDQQRISLARAMIRRPLIYLMDEPLGTLDAEVRLAMREFIREQQLAMNVTTIYVTHDQEEAMSLADRVVVMEAGRICQHAPPLTVYDSPASVFVANFVGSPGMNLVDGRIRQDGTEAVFVPDASDLALPVGAAIPGDVEHVILGIRSEHVTLDPEGTVAGSVLVEEYRGSHRSLHVETALGNLVVRADADTAYATGDSIRLVLPPEQLCFFEHATGVRCG